MDGQDYLEQISKTSRPVVIKQSRMKGWLSNGYVKFGIGALVAFILIMILGAFLGRDKNGPKEQSLNLLLHIDNTAALIDEYQPSVKSSTMRSNVASLGVVLKNTSRDLTNYLMERYELKSESDIDEKLIEQATLERDSLDQDLFRAKINGFLDRIMAHKMAYEISTITAEENKLMSVDKNETLQGLLRTSYNSLDNLYNYFNDFSETEQ